MAFVYITTALSCFAIQAVTISSNQEYTLDAYDAFVDVYDASILNMINYSGAAHVIAYDQSVVNIFTSGNISHLTMYNSATANIYNGNFSSINVYENSQINVYGLIDTSHFILDLNSHLTVYGVDLTYSDSFVHGFTTEGVPFGFNVSNIDGTTGEILFDAPTNVTLTTIPLPTSIVLFISGLLLLIKSGYKF